MATRMTIALLILGLCSGCSLFPRWMKPDSLWKLNAQDPASGESMYFSVPDPEVAAIEP